MTTVADVCSFLDEFAPTRLAEDWDNVGLLVGDGGQTVERVMTCLTITPRTAAEAVRRKAQLVVTHHPLPFRALKRLTTETTTGQLLLELIRHGVAIHSPHTAFDSALRGINQQLAEGLGLSDIRPLLAKPAELPEIGSGRYGTLANPVTLSAFAERLKQFVQVRQLQVVGDPARTVERIAVACGSAGSFLQPALQAKCDLLVTGETNFHTCLEAEASGIALLLPGHYASERFGVEQLAEVIARQFPKLDCWPSEDERDPVAWL